MKHSSNDPNQLSDCAFIDRADIVQYIDLPGREAIYDILRSCLTEVMAKGIIPTVVRSIPCSYTQAYQR